MNEFGWEVLGGVCVGVWVCGCVTGSDRALATDATAPAAAATKASPFSSDAISQRSSFIEASVPWWKSG